MKKLGILITFMLGLAFALMVPAAATAAEPPSDLDSISIQNPTGVLNESDVAQTQIKVDQQSPYNLYVVVVDTFSGQEGADWARTAATTSGLNPDTDVLFAIATQDRKYGSAYPSNSSVSTNIAKIEAAAIPFMKDGDWTGAVNMYGDAIIDAHAQTTAAGTSTSTGVSSTSVDIPWGSIGKVVMYILIGIVSLIALLFAASFIVAATRNKKVYKQALARYTDSKAKYNQEFIALDQKRAEFRNEIDYFTAQFPLYDTKKANAIDSDAVTAMSGLHRSASQFSTPHKSTSAVNEVQSGFESLRITLEFHDERIDDALKQFADMRTEANTAPTSQRLMEASLNTLERDFQAVEQAYSNLERNHTPAITSSVDGKRRETADLINQVKKGLDSSKRQNSNDQAVNHRSVRPALDTARKNTDSLLANSAQMVKDIEALPTHIMNAERVLKDNSDMSDQAEWKRLQSAIKVAKDGWFTTPLSETVGDLRRGTKELPKVAIQVRARRKENEENKKKYPALVKETRTALESARSFGNNHSHKLKGGYTNDLDRMERELDRISKPGRASEDYTALTETLKDLKRRIVESERKATKAVSAYKRPKNNSSARYDGSVNDYAILAAAAYVASSSSYSSSSSSSYSSSGSSFSSFDSSGGSFGGGDSSGGSF